MTWVTGSIGAVRTSSLAKTDLGSRGTSGLMAATPITIALLRDRDPHHVNENLNQGHRVGSCIIGDD